MKNTPNPASKKLFTILSLLLMAIVLLTTPAAALASESQVGQSAPQRTLKFDQFVFGNTYTLKTGETLKGNLLIFGGSATIETDATVTGDVALMGGSLSVNGKVNGSIAVAGGYLQLKEKAVVTGDITLSGGNLDQDPKAQVEGTVRHEPNLPFNITVPGRVNFNSPGGVQLPDFWVVFSPIWQGISFMMNIIVLSLLAMGVVMFWPRHTTRVSKAILAQPLTTGGLGLLTLMIAPLALLLMVITLVLIPITPIAIIIMIVTGVLGWIALGLEVGQRLAVAFKQEWHPVLTAGLGTLAMSFLALGVSEVVPWLGWLVPFLIIVMGIGAVLLTRFGTQDYTGTNPFAAPAPLQPAPVQPGSEPSWAEIAAVEPPSTIVPPVSEPPVPMEGQ